MRKKEFFHILQGQIAREDRFDPENNAKFILGVLVDLLVVALVIGVFYWGTQGGFAITKVSIIIVLVLGLLVFFLANYAIIRFIK